MKKMILTLMVVMMAVTACGKKDKKAVGWRNSNAANPRFNGSSDGRFGNIPLDGRLYLEDAYIFQSTIRGFVNFMMPEDQLGYVSNGLDGRNDTGAYFGGRVSLTSGHITSGGGSGQINPNSSVAIEVWDEHAAREGVPPVQLLLDPSTGTQVSGMVSGNSATITFQDQVGAIRISGSFDQAYFQGSLEYDNAVDYTGANAGGAGTVYFQIRTCSFFVCN